MNLIDIEKLVEPISAENPCGTAAEEFPAYNEISYLRKADEEGNNDERGWSFQPRQADWAKVKSKIINMLESESKDLQLLCWLAESLMHLNGLPGLSEGVSVINHSLIKHWDSLHPSGQSNELYREGLLIGLDRVISRYLHIFPFDADKEITLSNWCRVQAFEKRITIKPELKESLLKENYLPLKEWEKKIALFLKSHPDGIDMITLQLEMLHEELMKVNATAKTYSECISGTFKETFCKISEVRDFIFRFFSVVDVIPYADSFQLENTIIENLDTSGDTTVKSYVNAPGESSYVQQRAQSLAQLKQIITIFRDNEPGSPVPYLLERAIRWANMNVLEFLADIYNSESPHYAIGLQAIFGPKFVQDHDLLPPLTTSSAPGQANGAEESTADFNSTEHDPYQAAGNIFHN